MTKQHSFPDYLPSISSQLEYHAGLLSPKQTDLIYVQGVGVVASTVDTADAPASAAPVSRPRLGSEFNDIIMAR